MIYKVIASINHSGQCSQKNNYEVVPHAGCVGGWDCKIPGRGQRITNKRDAVKFAKRVARSQLVHSVRVCLYLSLHYIDENEIVFECKGRGA